MIKIYFPHKVVIITYKNLEKFNDSNGLIIRNWSEDIANSLFEKSERTKETQLVISHDNINAVLDSLKEKFTVIQAAGGAVILPNAEILMIYRRGKWDLPKGKLDEGETIEACAVREVEEETGLIGVNLGKHLITTYHTYLENDENILKETFWYMMFLDKKQELKPQVEEDIQECRWVPITELSAFENNMQPSVKDVLNTIKELQ